MKKHEGKTPSAKAAHREDASGADAFEREMADVVPLAPDPKGRFRGARPVSPPPTASSSGREAGEADGLNEDFAAHGVDRREIRKLHRGDYFVGARRDLHGLSAGDACASVRRFIDNSRHSRLRCICIVHGRGVHSAQKTSIVKARVRECLKSHPSVLAFADAPRTDGGAGAVYVLLRR